MTLSENGSLGLDANSSERRAVRALNDVLSVTDQNQPIS